MPIEFRRLRRLAPDHENYSYIFRGDERLLKRKRDPLPHLAARFSGKEVLIKALGDVGIGHQAGVAWR